MIIDNIQNVERYRYVHPGFAAAIDYLKNGAASDCTGKITLDGDKVFVLCQSYNTVPCSESKWECHRNYIDIQYIVSGTESMGWAPLTALPEDSVYNEAKDCCFASRDIAGAYLTAGSGDFCIFFPEDLHKPKCAADGESSYVNKRVIKIAL